MKAAALLPMFVIGAWLVQGDSDPEKAVKDIIKGMEDATAVLKTVKDQKSAEAAVPKLEEPTKRLKAATETMKKMEGDPNAIKQKEKHAEKLKTAALAFGSELQRLLKEPELHKVLLKSELWSSLDGARQENQKKTQAIIDAHFALSTLDNAVAAYRAKHGAWPQTLKQLTQRDPVDYSPALLTEAMLTDPWGRLYRYEPQTLHPKTGTPLLYSDGPDPKDPKGRIKSWD